LWSRPHSVKPGISHRLAVFLRRQSFPKHRAVLPALACAFGAVTLSLPLTFLRFFKSRGSGGFFKRTLAHSSSAKSIRRPFSIRFRATVSLACVGLARSDPIRVFRVQGGTFHSPRLVDIDGTQSLETFQKDKQHTSWEEITLPRYQFFSFLVSSFK